MSLSGYVIKLEQLYQTAKSHKMQALDEVLAYRLLNKANLPKEKKQLVRATFNEVKCEIMKDKLKKVFTNLSFEKRSKEEEVKLEQSNSFYVEDFLKREHNENALNGESVVQNTPRNRKCSYQKNKYQAFLKSLRYSWKLRWLRIVDSKFYWTNKCPD